MMAFSDRKRRLFQVYAPNEMEAKKAVAKIRDDFAGARDYWGSHFDAWTFVHNAIDGLPPHVHETILEIQEQSQGKTLDIWGLEELRIKFLLLSGADKLSWLGAAPTEEANAKLGFDDLRVVLESLASKKIPADTEIDPVPASKIEANDLSASVAVLLENGMAKAPLVSSFLETWHDETLGGRLAAAFRRACSAWIGSSPKSGRRFAIARRP